MNYSINRYNTTNPQVSGSFGTNNQHSFEEHIIKSSGDRNFNNTSIFKKAEELTSSLNKYKTLQESRIKQQQESKPKKAEQKNKKQLKAFNLFKKPSTQKEITKDKELENIEQDIKTQTEEFKQTIQNIKDTLSTIDPEEIPNIINELPEQSADMLWEFIQQHLQKEMNAEKYNHIVKQAAEQPDASVKEILIQLFKNEKHNNWLITVFDGILSAVQTGTDLYLINNFAKLAFTKFATNGIYLSTLASLFKLKYDNAHGMVTKNKLMTTDPNTTVSDNQPKSYPTFITALWKTVNDKFSTKAQAAATIINGGLLLLQGITSPHSLLFSIPTEVYRFGVQVYDNYNTPMPTQTQQPMEIESQNNSPQNTATYLNSPQNNNTNDSGYPANNNNPQQFPQNPNSQNNPYSFG